MSNLLQSLYSDPNTFKEGDKIFIGPFEAIPYELRGQEGTIKEIYTDDSALIELDFPIFDEYGYIDQELNDPVIDLHYLTSLED